MRDSGALSIDRVGARAGVGPYGHIYRLSEAERSSVSPISARCWPDRHLAHAPARLRLYYAAMVVLERRHHAPRFDKLPPAPEQACRLTVEAIGEGEGGGALAANEPYCVTPRVDAASLAASLPADRPVSFFHRPSSRPHLLRDPARQRERDDAAGIRPQPDPSLRFT
jgi:hypothetical protein